MFLEQIFGLLLEGVGGRRGGLAQMKENQAAFQNIWMRIHLEEREVRVSAGVAASCRCSAFYLDGAGKL